MTKREFLKYELLKDLAIPFNKNSFKLIRSNDEFYKKNKDGWNNFQVLFYDTESKDGWIVNTAFGIRLNKIEDIYHRTSGFEKKYQKNTPTIGCAFEDYIGDYKNYRFSLFEEEDIKPISEKIQKIFENYAINFFEKYSNLQAVDNLLNENPLDTKFTGDIFKGSKGLILAKVTGRPNYKELEVIYKGQYETFSDGFYLPEFKKLVEDLNTNF